MLRQSFRRVLHFIQLQIFLPDIPHRRHSHLSHAVFSDQPEHAAVLALQSLNRAQYSITAAGRFASDSGKDAFDAFKSRSFRPP